MSFFNYFNCSLPILPPYVCIILHYNGTKFPGLGRRNAIMINYSKGINRLVFLIQLKPTGGCRYIYNAAEVVTTAVHKYYYRTVIAMHVHK